MSTGRPLNSALEPRWIGVSRNRPALIPLSLRGWLLDGGSLTARLRALCREGFRVRIRRLRWGQPLHSESRLLRGRRGLAALVREVELSCGNQPWVFARTIIPATSLRGPARRLGRLGDRPLGQLLFTQPGTRRGTTEIARLLPGHVLFGAAVDGLQQVPGEVWGRRTLFYFSGRPLLVNEIFLPTLPASPL